MAWRADTKLNLPDELDQIDALEVDADEDDDDVEDHTLFVKDVVTEIFKAGHLEPGLYYVRASGQKGNNADNLNISINRTA